MTQYEAGMKKAQDIADMILELKNNRFLENVPAHLIRMDADSYVPDIPCWFRLLGYTSGADETVRKAQAGRAVTHWLRSSLADGQTAAFALVKDGGELFVMYGGHNVSSIFRSDMSEARIERMSWDPAAYGFNGLMTGTVSSDGLADVIASAKDMNAFVSCVAEPVPEGEIEDMLLRDRELLAFFNEHKSFERVYGNSTRRVEQVQLQNVIRALPLVADEIKYLENYRGQGLVRTYVKYGADNERDLKLLANLIASARMRTDGDEASAYEPVRNFIMSGQCSGTAEVLGLPLVRFQVGSQEMASNPMTIGRVSSAVSFCLPPENSARGFYIKRYGSQGRDMFSFPEYLKGRQLYMGNLVEAEGAAAIPLKSLHAHTAVFGATNTGKSTTVQKLLIELWEREHIPFVVIEGAKKEYGEKLLEHIPELAVYTSGLDGIPLQINPLEPEPGTLIENHVEVVTRSLMASCQGEHPIPEAFQGLLKMTYEQKGWRYGMMAYRDKNKPFPGFSELLANVDAYIAEHARYGPEVRQNLTAALKLRTETMGNGALGALFEKPFGLLSEDLLAVPSVIELADFSETSIAFLMNIILFRLQCYLKHQPDSRVVKRLIVVEEAHNVFRKTIEEDSGRALNNAAFEKMLAEVRSSGTGMIIADQRPSILSDAVIANTTVKIVHGLEADSDREIIKTTQNLTDIQAMTLKDMPQGECLISVRGVFGVQHARIRRAEHGREITSACMRCKSRIRCRKNAVISMLDGMNSEKVNYHISKLMASVYNTELLKRNIDAMLMDLNVQASRATKACFLGEILKRRGLSMQESRIIVNSYFE